MAVIRTCKELSVVFYWYKWIIFFLKGNLIEKRSQRKYTLSPFPLTWSTIYPSTLFWCELQRCRCVWRYRLERCLPSHDYNCARWHWASGVYSAKEYKKNSAAKSFSINQDPNTQDNTWTLLWAVSCRNYFLSTEPHQIMCRRAACACDSDSKLNYKSIISRFYVFTQSQCCSSWRYWLIIPSSVLKDC